MFPRLMGLASQSTSHPTQRLAARALVLGLMVGSFLLTSCSDDDGADDSGHTASGSSSSSGGSSAGGDSNGSGSTSGSGGSSSPTCDDDFCQGFLDAHNAIRQAVNEGTYNGQPKADPPLPMMFWDPLIAAKAQEYADRVDDWSDGHSSSEFRTYASTSHSGYHGENMAIGGGSYAEPENVVGNSWGASESQGCVGAECGGHYTQIVWRESVGLGCGQKENVPFGNGNRGTLTVCQYGPGGNINGRAPY